jgi:DNA invertase Pin-like site-specific DNA recombinase
MNAIVYLRVSSEEQLNGNGIDRQLETVRAYCKQNNLTIVQTIKDEGKSASKGKHISDGKLGKLLSAIRRGAYRDHALVIEYLDRLSRLGIEQTFAILSDLRKNGVELHEAKNNRVIRSLDDLGTGIVTMVDSYQAAEYSAKLRERATKAWTSKREKMRTNHQPMTALCPAWVEVVDDGLDADGKRKRKFVFKEDMAALVREIFDLAAQGVGTHNILQRLNGRLGGRSLSWVAKTLKNRAVLGEYRYKRGGEPVMLYKPIITQAQYDAARLVIDKKLRNDGKVRGGRYSGQRVDNLFSKLVWDTTEGDPRPMCYQRVQRKGKTSGEYLRTAPSGDERETHSISYPRLESAILSFLEAADWKEIAGHTESEDYKKAVSELDIVLRKIDKTSRLIATANTAMEADDIDVATIKVLAGRVVQYESELATLAERKDTLQAKVNAARSACEALYRPEILLELVRQTDTQTAETFALRLRLKTAISDRIRRIDIEFKDRKPVKATIEFINAYHAFLLF